MGQSVTLTGRSIVRHMNAQINKELTGEYDYAGAAICYADTDSFSFDSQILSTRGDMSVADLFCLLPIKWSVGDKEYSGCPDTKVMSYDPRTNQKCYKNINYIYRHKVSKEKWKITDQLGNEIIVTGDHSVMIERDNVLIEIKPRDMLQNDVLISIVDRNIR